MCVCVLRTVNGGWSNWRPSGVCSAIAGVSCGGHGFIFHGSCLRHVNKCCVVCMCTDFKPMSCMYVAT